MSGIDRYSIRSLFLSQQTDTICRPSPGDELAITVDTMVEGVHFVAGVDPFYLGQKLMAVNLSDLAAMGAQPRWTTLALVLPRQDLSWLRALRDGLRKLGDRYAVEMVTLDCVQGPLNLTLQAYGTAPHGQSLLRAGARAGDLVYVTGTPGDAGLALQHRLHSEVIDEFHGRYLDERLDCPQPRVEAGLQLRSLATAAIDISDGLAADLGHILEASGVGAVIHVSQLPLSEAMHFLCDDHQAWQYALGSGDDYELCFTVAPERKDEVPAIARELDLAMTCVGEIVTGGGLRILDPNGEPVTLQRAGYNHFKT